MTDFIVAIPARFASTRLPGKPLSLIGGKAMIQHVAERALAAGAKQVVAFFQGAVVACQAETDTLRQLAERGRGALPAGFLFRKYRGDGRRLVAVHDALLVLMTRCRQTVRR